MDASLTSAALRGLGRSAYRAGLINPVPFATKHAGRELTASERSLVCEGWRDERSEASVLSPLAAGTAVLTSDGAGVVMCSARGYVTVLRGRIVAVYALWEVSPIFADVDYTDDERAWFKQPVREEAVS